LQSGGLITNYNCTSKCRHCLYKCSPARSKDYIDEETTRKNLRMVKKLGCNALHIGGGEPFLQFEKLLGVIKVFREENMQIDYIETNSSWYRDEQQACKMLEQIKSEGVNTLLVSISPFHNEYIPFEKVKGVINACHRVNIHVFPWVMNFYQEMDQLNPGEKHNMEEYQNIYGKNYLAEIPHRYWIHFGGRAIETYAQAYGLKKYPEISNHKGCTELWDTSHFHVDLYGNYIPGLCSGLVFPIEYLNTTMKKEDFPVLVQLAGEGIKALADFCMEKTGDLSNGKYLNKCHLCNIIRKKLIDEGTHFSELGPEEYYLS
jgi:hypothetical protein